ncbi:Subtilisin-like protease [Rhynchospora pubera]|uniref:Subtilisin-like protease n=1 Tax=Rhynchospora pubera TaxID=906938 RepID=A0AAV8H6N0_9POAL|nr:Subtilisin-like protease [Rhynchospora pubera]
MESHPLFLRAIPAGKPYKLLTTHTPDFLQLRGSNGLWKKTKNMGEGVIVGILDTGITPGHPSFDDKGMRPPPAKWKGHCDFNASVCNNKLIGAKSFLKAGADELKHLPPFDVETHGTHTAGTAVGASVKNVNILGIGLGEASGVAPRAHLAVYRVCSEEGCQTPDIIKGIEEAVNDGCDVISLSLGPDSGEPFYLEPVALGGFYATLKGVFVSAAAGNNGPNVSSVSNDAPWILTVAASSTDRQIRSTVKLGSGLLLNGESMYQPKNWTSKMLPLVYLAGKGAPVNADKCLDGTLDSKVVKGKIVLCDRGVNTRVEKGLNVHKAGGAGMILANDKPNAYSTDADRHFLPASHISYVDGLKIKDYIHSTKNPTATVLFKGVGYHTPFNPSIASFSSRGPSLASPLILKPDIAGPGVSIVAAVPTVSVGNKAQIFDFMSGTSMATPHLSGIAALIKKAHPNWSPAAIKSAMMTTTDATDINGKPILDQVGNIPADVFAMGAGQVNPYKALEPGLVYDLTPDEYIRYLCGLDYIDEDVNAIIHPAPKVQCAKVKVISQEQLNYPSIVVPIPKRGTKTIYRTVTNVGEANDSYKAVISVPKGVSMKVVPSTLKFKSLNEKKSFKIVFKGSGKGHSTGELKWVSSKHVVRSPVLISN